VVKTSPPEGVAVLELCVLFLADKHIGELRAYDVRGVSSLTDYYLVGTARNERQMKAAGQNVTRQMKKMGIHALHQDGQMGGNWVVLDYVDCIVHLFNPAMRTHYDIEAMWRAHEIPVPQPDPRSHAGAQP